MSRDQHKNIEPPDVKKWSGIPDRRTIGGTAVLVEKRQYSLVTPLFGGGVEPSQADPVTLIRATEIRGHLRFWWRAICGGQFNGDLAAMKAREDEIWGTASTVTRLRDVQEKPKDGWKEALQVVVTNIQRDEKAQGILDLPPYAAFPLTDQDGAMQPRVLTHHPAISSSLSFDLLISYPVPSSEEAAQKRKDDIHAALWAWETFGGIGARTRRGFGVVQASREDQSTLPPANPRGAEEWLRERLKTSCASGTFPEHVPHLSATMPMHLVGPAVRPTVAWKNSVNKLKNFRQYPHGRDKRSQWPEAETIRRMTGYRSSRVRPLNQPQKFPRAMLGLPIVFHFKDEDTRRPPRRNFDPPEMTLQGPEGQERLASPLILRPLLCRNGQALSFACVLQGSTLPAQLFLVSQEENGKRYAVDGTAQTHVQAQEQESLPVLLGEPDALQAFMRYLKKEGK